VSRRFDRVKLPLADGIRGWGLTPIDIDNDGWIDLAAIIETNAGPRVRVFRNRGDGSFEDVSCALVIAARSAACCIEAIFAARMRKSWRGFARREH
jgi:hypothetical protein